MKISRHQGFTLIELLVVIAIIALLASISIPIYGSVQEKAQRARCLAQAKGIFPALKLFAGDHNSSYPSMPEQDERESSGGGGGRLENANQAFANLIPDYMASESPFGNNSKFCRAPGVNGPDNNIDGKQNKLKRGENAYAYVDGLTETSNASWPIIADGFADESTDPKYSKLDGEYGGVWKGKVAIVVRNDGSAKEEKIDSRSLKVIRPGSGQKNLFSEDRDENNPWLVGCKVLNPAK